jgi:hypothetical protein
MKAPVFILAAFALFANSADAQSFSVYVPSNTPNVGTCNVFPLGSATFTYAGGVPASYFAGSPSQVMDLGFAPCATTTFIAPQIQMGLGHIPWPMPNPFTFPTFDTAGNVTSMGSFLTYTPIWNSVAQGSFTWIATQDTWSRFNFAPTGGTQFNWNGVDAVAWFITHQSATGTTGCHRTNTDPFRVYASGVYQAAVSNGSGASGLIMEFVMGSGNLATATPIGTGCGGLPGVTPTLSTMQAPFLGNPAFSMDIGSAPVFSDFYVFGSVGLAASPIPVGGSCFVYLEPVSLSGLIASGFLPFGPFNTGATGSFNLPFPIPFQTGLLGQHIGIQVAILDITSPIGVDLTNALDLLIN